MGLILPLICLAIREPLKYPKGEVVKLWILGFLSMGVYMVLFLEGLKGSTPAEAAILLATAPIWTALMAVVSRQEAFNWGAVGGALLAFAGVAMVVFAAGSGAHGKLMANLMVLGSAVLWAASAVISKPLLSKISPIRVLTLSLPGALPVLIPYGLTDSLNVNWQALSPVAVGMFCHVVLLAGIVGFIGFYAGVRQVGSAGAMLYQYFVPPIAALSAWIVLGTKFLPLQGVGLLVVLFGVGWSSNARRQ